MILLGTASIRSYRWEYSSTETRFLGSDRYNFYTAPSRPPELNLELTPLILTPAGEEHFRGQHWYEVGLVDLKSHPPLIESIKALIAAHGKNEVAVALDSVLEKL